MRPCTWPWVIPVLLLLALGSTLIVTHDLWKRPPPVQVRLVPGPDTRELDFSVGPLDINVGDDDRRVTVWFTGGAPAQRVLEFTPPIWPSVAAIWSAATAGLVLYWRRCRGLQR